MVDVTTQGYSQDYLEAVGPAGEGSYVRSVTCSSRRRRTSALQEYITWLEKMAPDEEPTSNGLTAWIRAQMFYEAAVAVGPELTRDKLIEEITTMEDFDAGGLTPADRRGQAGAGRGLLPDGPGAGRQYVRVFPEEGFHCSADDIYEYAVRLSELLASRSSASSPARSTRSRPAGWSSRTPRQACSTSPTARWGCSWLSSTGRCGSTGGGRRP